RDDFEATLAGADLAKLRHGPVRYPPVKKLKPRLLERAFANFSAEPREDRQSAFAQFCAEEKTWLDDYVLFRALMEQNSDSVAWDKWKREHRTMKSAHVWLRDLPQDQQSHFLTRQNFFRYVQWIAREQWRETKSFAQQHDIALMGDIPFGVSYYSADVFARPDEFALDWCGGAPPEPYFKDDEFTQKWGQNWGIPLYRWDLMRTRNFAWWRQRIRGVRKIFHVFRIDHVLGFYRIYAFPWRPERNPEFLALSWDEMRERTGGAIPQFYPRDDSTWENCEANRREGEEYLRVILEESGDTCVVGEDLGTVPYYVRPSLRSLGVATFKIPQWENYDDGRSISGRDYQRLSVATYATHDHKPLRALWQETFSDSTAQQAQHDLGKIAEFAGVPPPSAQADFDTDFYAPVMEALFRSESWIAIIM